MWGVLADRWGARRVVITGGVLLGWGSSPRVGSRRCGNSRVLRCGHDYVDIGEKAYDHRFQTRRLAALTETAKSLGYTLVPAPANG
jgi:hypothetical protein